MDQMDLQFYKYKMQELEKENIELHKQIQKLVEENTELMNMLSINNYY